MHLLLARAALAADTTTFDPQPPWVLRSAEDALVMDVAIGDFDADGYDDLAIARTGPEGTAGLGVAVHRGGPEGPAQAPDLAWTPPAVLLDGIGGGPTVLVRLAAGDVTGDGVDDLVVGHPGGTAPAGHGRLDVHPGSPSGLSSVAASSHAGPDRLGLDLAVGDLDGDGVADVLAARDDGADDVWEWWRGGAAGLSATGWGRTGDGIVVADVTGDGVDDLSRFDFGAYTVDVLAGAPGGPAVAWSVAATPVGLGAADADGDGVHDLVVYDFADGGRLDWFDVADGAAAPFATHDAPPVGAVTGLGDLDRDGVHDWLVAGEGARAWLVRGSDPEPPWPGTYDVLSTAYGASYAIGVQPAVGDLDGDGCRDLVLDVDATWIVVQGYYSDLYDADSLVAGYPCPLDPLEVEETGDTGEPPDTDLPEPTEPGEPTAEPPPPDEKGRCGCASTPTAAALVPLVLISASARRRRRCPRRARS